jgi:hypothetical protein
LAARGGPAVCLREAARFVRRRQTRERRWARRRSAQPAPPELHSEPPFPAAVRYALTAAARPLRLGAAEEEAAAWFAWALRSVPGRGASGQAPSAPGAGRQAKEHRSEARSLPEAVACRQSLAVAKASRLASSSAAAWARRWVASVVWVAAAVQRSGQTAALRAPEAAEVAAQPDAGAAGAEEARHAGAAAEEGEPRVAGVAAEAEVVAQPDAAAVLRPAGAPDVRAQPRAARPSAAAWAAPPCLQAERLAP